MKSRISKMVFLSFFMIASVGVSLPLVWAADPPKDRLVPTIKAVLPSPGWRSEQYEATTLILKNWEKLRFTLDIKTAPNFVTFTKMVDDP